MKKQRRIFPLILTVLILVLGLGAFGAWKYQSRFAPVGEERYEKTIQTIDLSNRPVDDLTQLLAFPGLKQIDLRGSGLSCREFDTLTQWFPEAAILWDIPFQGAFHDMNTESLTLTALTEADMALLPYFTRLKTVHAENCPDLDALQTLRTLRPDLEVIYQIPVGDTLQPYDVTELTLPGDDVEYLFDCLPYLTELEAVEFLPPLAPADRLLALVETFPQIRFTWELTLAGMTVNESTETLDLTGIPMTVEEMDGVLPYLPGLTYVDMTDCGISDEEMDALNSRYENIKIVWTVSIGHLRYKTDITTFMPYKDGLRTVYNSHLYNLRYCHDVIAVDLGHNDVSDISFAAYMPHLKFLLLGDTRVADLTPLTGLTELVYLEMFITNVRECDALLTLTGLEDLNICYTNCDPEVIAQMTWLKNLWWAKAPKAHRETIAAALADTHIVFDTYSATGEGWRELPNYYAQRDAFGLEYMTG